MAAVLVFAGAALAEPAEDFEAVFGTEAAKAAASKSPAEAAALARRILEAAKTLTDSPATQAYFYEKALAFGARGPAGASYALEAIALLAQAHPDRKNKWLDAKVEILEMLFNRSGGSARMEAATAYIDALVELTDAQLAAGKRKEALQTCHKAASIAPRAAHRFEEIRDRIRTITAAIEAQTQRDKLLKKLAENPKDDASRGQLILLYVMEMDDLPKAAELLTVDSDEQLRLCVSAAAKKPDGLSETECLTLGDWYYQTLFPKASKGAKPRMLLRAQACYERFLWLHATEDAPSLRVKLRLEEVLKAGRALEGTVDQILVEALIDGDSELHLTPQGIYWKQATVSKPGRHTGVNYPTYVNGRPWMPAWGNPNQERGDDVSKMLPLPIGKLNFAVQTLAVGGGPEVKHPKSITGIEPRSPVTIRSAQGEQIVSIPDAQGGSKWYRLRLYRSGR